MATVTQIKRKTGAVWRLSWVDPATGKQERRVIGDTSVVSKGDAHAALKTLELELATNKTNSVVGLSGRGRVEHTWEQTTKDYLTAHARAYPSSHWRTRLALSGKLGEWMEGQTIEHLAVHPELIEEYLDTRLEDLAPASRNKELRAYKALFNWCVEKEILAGHKLKKVKEVADHNDTFVKFYTREHLAALFAKSRVRTSPIWRLLANTGLRNAEAMKLLKSDVNEATNSIQVISTNARRTKSSKKRFIPIGAGARQALEELKLLVPDGEYVLPHFESRFTMSHLFHDDAVSAKIGGHMHMLRHTFASHLIMQGKPMYEVSQILGHASIKTTEKIYVHLTPGHLQSTVEGFSL